MAVAGLPFAAKTAADGLWSIDDTEGVPVGLPDLTGRRSEPTPIPPASSPPLSLPPDDVAAADAESSDVFALPEEVVAESWAAPPEPSEASSEAPKAPPVAPPPTQAPDPRVADGAARVAELEVALAAARSRAVGLGMAAFAVGAAIGVLVGMAF